MARRYRMTPKRRAALHKAQQASARKRRRTRNKRIAIGAGVVGTVGILSVAGVAGHSYVKHLRRPYRPSAFNPTHQLALPPGRSVTKVRKEKRSVHHRPGVFKVASPNSADRYFSVTPHGTASVRTALAPHYVKRNRPNYDWLRRKGFEPGYEKKARTKYDGLSPRTARRRAKNRG